MRRLAIAFVCLVVVFPGASLARSIPRPQGYVSDFASVILPADKSQIEGWVVELKGKTGVEVAVVTMPTLEGDSIDDYAVDLFREWGIGKRGEDNGLLILVVTRDREMRIEVGYGLEGVIPDALAGRIARDRMFPRFLDGDYSTGILEGVRGLVEVISAKLDVRIEGGGGVQPLRIGAERPGGIFPFLLRIVIGIFIFFLFIRHPFLFLFFLGSMGWGFGGGGFSRGGFGGFGGGLSGGGGFSGRW